jgi:hypothetical protein
VDYKIGETWIQQLVANTRNKAKFPELRKTVILLGASLSLLFHIPSLLILTHLIKERTHEVSSATRISYGAQSLPYSSFPHSLSDFELFK